MMYNNNLLAAIESLVSKYYQHHSLHVAIVAQWLLESDRGNSKLAIEHNNFAGMKWREELKPHAIAKDIKVPSEPTQVKFAYFETPAKFVDGYFAFLSRLPYRGWETRNDPQDFIAFIGARWATDPNYRKKVVRMFPEANELITKLERGVRDTQLVDATWFEFYPYERGVSVVAYAGSVPLYQFVLTDTLELSKLHALFGLHNVETAPPGKTKPEVAIIDIDSLGSKPVTQPTIPPGTYEPAAKPKVIWESSPNQSSRNGTPIRRIVLHYTTSSNPYGTVAWFKNPAARVSAHYMVARDGRIWQFVKDSDKAWHAAGHNADTIGIENVAAVGQKLTDEQEVKLIELLKYLMAEYKIPKSSITGHKWLPNSTSCPGSLWETKGELERWIDANL